MNKKKKVNFMLLGAMKCGTSTLTRILSRHPDISICKKKEPKFFSHNKNWKKNIQEYHDLFNFKDGKIFGEASTTYTRYPQYNLEIWNDIYEYNSEMKLLYIVRNPVDRAISQYMDYYERGSSVSTIDNFVLDPKVINICRYYMQIKPFIEKFGSSNVLIIDFDDLIFKRKELLESISDFLGISFIYFDNYEEVHVNRSLGGYKRTVFINKNLRYLQLLNFLPKSLKNKIFYYIFKLTKRELSKKPRLSDETKKAIINLTKLDIVELEKLTGKDFSKWKNL